MKLIVDMNLSPQWVEALRNAGMEAVHWSVIGAATASDTEIMTYARVHHCIVLTHDLDFGAILAATQASKPSVVQIRSDDLSLDLIGKPVIAALQQMQQELLSGALLTVDPKRTRIRILPLLTKN